MNIKPTIGARDESAHGKSLAKMTFWGMVVIGLFGGTIGVWSATAPISGAVLSNGKLVVTSNRRAVQHANGGIVGKLNVSEGMFVEKDQVLIELDATVTRVRLGVIDRKLDELHARASRLRAEQKGMDEISFPEHLTERTDIEEVSTALATEHALFQARRGSQQKKSKQLRERIGQLNEEIKGLVDISEAKKLHADITQDELKKLSKLAKSKLVRLDRYNNIKRDWARITGELAENRAKIAQLKGRITEVELQILSAEEDIIAEASKELREVQAEISQLNEQRIAAIDELSRVNIRAPITGQVIQLQVHTIGGVVKPADKILEIVPVDETLEVQAPIQPQDFDQLHIGQEANIKLQALNRRTTPELKGRIKWLPSDALTDERTGATYYNARIALTSDSIEKLKDVKLVAGMGADIFITTTPRTFASFIAQPIIEQMDRAFTER